MAFAGQHLRFTWKFAVASTDEIAETNLCYTGATPWTAAAASLAELDAGDLEDLSDAMATLMGTTGLNWALYSSLVGVKAAAIDTTGSYVAGADPVEFVDTTPPTGTAGNIPPQSTVCVSTRTVTNIGQGVKGRMFLPHTLMTLPSGFAITSSTTRDDIADAAALFIAACTSIINAAITATVGPAIMGQTGSGTVKAITEVRVGGVNDTQRRRRNNIPEVYSVTAVP